MPNVDEQESAAPVVGMVVVILAILTLGFWFLAGSPRSPERSATLAELAVAPVPDAAIDPPREAQRAPARDSPHGMGAGMSIVEAPVFAAQDIHKVPLGEILDYAQTLPFDEARGHEESMGTNEKGQEVTIRIWPESGASSMEAAALRQGRIVARIESNHAFEALGLADGVNYLWVEHDPAGGYRGVIIPATAFAPLFDLEHVLLTEHTPSGVPLEKGAYWVNGRPWIACGRC